MKVFPWTQRDGKTLFSCLYSILLYYLNLDVCLLMVKFTKHFPCEFCITSIAEVWILIYMGFLYKQTKKLHLVMCTCFMLGSLTNIWWFYACDIISAWADFWLKDAYKFLFKQEKVFFLVPLNGWYHTNHTFFEVKDHKKKTSTSATKGKYTISNFNP